MQKERRCRKKEDARVRVRVYLRNRSPVPKKTTTLTEKTTHC
jgi:hypothetical protein